MTPDLTILQGDCRDMLREIPDCSIHCCVTSPPYFGLRDYNVAGQIGLEVTPDAYVTELVEVFREVRRVLRDDGTCWVNLGDSYWGSWQNYGGGNRGAGKQRPIIKGSQAQNPVWEGLEGYRPAATQKHPTLKPKDLIGIPWAVAFALRADGWYLRQDIIWAKPNPMPESVTDRCTKSHEYLFLLSKSERYYFDQSAVAEPVADATVSRLEQDIESQEGSWRVPGKTNGAMKAVRRRADRFGGNTHVEGTTKHSNGSIYEGRELRNKRSVWQVATQPYKEAHFAVYPVDLIKPCILAGCPAGGVVLDPFAGSGTTGAVALELGRSAILIELNPEYVKLIEKRCRVNLPLMFEQGGGRMNESELIELARRVADAAAAADIVFDARCKLDFGGIAESDASDILLRAENAAQLAVESAVREYRASVEAAAFMARPAVRRGLEKLGEMEAVSGAE